MFVKYSVFITCMYLLRDMPIVMCIFFLIQIHTFLLFNVLKRCISIYLDNKLFLFLFLFLFLTEGGDVPLPFSKS